MLGFRSVAGELKKKRPRPRWKTSLVSQQQLRWLRTSLLGRIPGWSPPVAPVGPWRAVRLDAGPVCLSGLRLHSCLDGATGVVTLHARAHAATCIKGARFRVADRESVASSLSQPQVNIPIEVSVDRNGQEIKLHLSINLKINLE